jgi:PAS domain S-box-containing protein
MQLVTARSDASGFPMTRWLEENGPRQLELLFRAIIYHPAAPVLIADNERTSIDASVGASRLLGVPREKIIGRKLEDFAAPVSKPHVSELWRALLNEDRQDGEIRIQGPNGLAQTLAFKAKPNILPVRHVVLLQDKSAQQDLPVWVQDYALFLIEPGGAIASWYAGARRIFNWSEDEAIGRPVSFLYPDDDTLDRTLEAEFQRCASEGHFGTECWQTRKDGSRFWANSITMALKDEQGALRGFASVVRDFTDRRERDEELRRVRALKHLPSPHSSIAGVVAGEFDRTPDVNDAFLELSGYTREDLQAGLLHWPDLTPPEYNPVDELAHEEGLRFGACMPYEKEIIRKDGTRVPVLIATAVLKLSPFRWITFVQNLRPESASQPVEVSTGNERSREGFEEMVGASASLRRVEELISVVAPTDATVLILGETGTGKELVARAVHRISPRRNLPFVTLNCAAIPTGLLESELFGYERGAFTGALRQKIGRFEMAHRGTLFLDEVGDIPLDLQPKLLRALQEKSFERLGGTKTIPIDVRLVAATNRNLAQMMGDKLFRSDLYYRLKVFPVATPALRDRPEDIPLLAWHFVSKYAGKMGKRIETIPAATMRALVGWPWPGNVRELENFMERSVILTQGSALFVPLDEIKEEAAESGGSAQLDEIEREHIIKVLRECQGVVTAAAARLGMPRTTLNAMMRRLGISRDDS